MGRRHCELIGAGHARGVEHDLGSWGHRQRETDQNHFLPATDKADDCRSMNAEHVVAANGGYPA